NVDALAAGLGDLVADLPILHTQDCISARAAARVRDAAAGPPPVVVRTVHHVDDFTSPSLINCQRQAILEPDRILVVSERWREILAEDYSASADVVHNGVDVARFRSADPDLVVALRQRAGAGDRPLILAVGGIEPRKGSDTLMAAVAALGRQRGRSGRRPVVASDLPVFREYLRPGQDALMVPVDNAAALTAALGAVLDDAALAGRLRAAGYQVCARFTWDRSAAEHQRIYADLKWR